MTASGPGGPGMGSGAAGHPGTPPAGTPHPGGGAHGGRADAANGPAEPATGRHLRQRVIVVSPFGRHQVDLPADVPVSGFLPDLLAGVGLYPRQGGSASPGWQLEAAEGRVLAPGETLLAQGIPPGAVLWLRGGVRPDRDPSAGYQASAPGNQASAPGNQASAPGYQPGWSQPGGNQAGGHQADRNHAAGYQSEASQPGGYPADGRQPGDHQPGGHQPGGHQGGGHQGGGHRAAGNQPTGHRASSHRASGAPRRAARPAGPGAVPPASGGHLPPASGGRSGDQRGRSGEGPPASNRASGQDQPRWPSRTPLPPAAPIPADDGLTPLERTQAVLPSPVPRARRLMAAAEVLLKRAQPADSGVIAVGPGIQQPAPQAPDPGGPGDRQAEELAAQEAAEPAGPLHLIPADLTVAAAPTRAERVRAAWRDLDHIGQLDARIAKPRLHRCATIAVVSPKGGVGKTTVVALLGTLFSLLRRDPVVAVDTNPDFGSLGRVLAPDQSWYVDDLARLVAEEDELSLTALESRLGRAVHGLLVVPAPTDPVRMAALDERAYRRVITRLKDFFSVILLDCGTGLQDPSSAAAVAAADHVVLITDAQPATASLVAESAGLLLHSGRPMSVVVNRMPTRGTRLDLARLSQYIPAARGLVVVPDEASAAARLATGSFNWRDAPASWQRALRELAVVIAADWERLGLAR